MKTIIELARKVGLLDGTLPVPQTVERFATLVKAAHTAELVAGVEMPEPVGDVAPRPDVVDWYSYEPPFGTKLYTAYQLRETVAAAVLREREAGKSATVETLLRIEKESDLLCANFDALKAENEHLRACVNGRTSNDAATVELLRAENERLRADAARYQLIRRAQHWNVIDGIGRDLRADELDAAISAAMKGQP